MLRALRLAAAMLAGLAVPALAIPAMAQTALTRPVTPSITPTTAMPHTATTNPATPSAAKPATTSTAAPAMAAPTATTGKRIDINSASETEIATLPGIGPVTAKAIVAGRPWDDLGNLVKNKVMAKSVYDRNKDSFALANINTSSAADMAKTLPGIGDATAPKIVNGRPYAKPNDLVGKKVLTEAQYNKIKNVVTY